MMPEQAHRSVTAASRHTLAWRAAVLAVMAGVFVGSLFFVAFRIPEWVKDDRGARQVASAVTPRASVQDRLLKLINDKRGQAGCPALRADERLGAAAQAHARDMIAGGYVDQIAPSGSTPTARATAAGYPEGRVVERIGAGLAGAQDVLAQWLNPQTRAVLGPQLRDCGLVAAGIGYQPGTARPGFGPGVWVLDMGSR
jgi:uncharacterized protein YkwD